MSIMDGCIMTTTKLVEEDIDDSKKGIVDSMIGIVDLCIICFRKAAAARGISNLVESTSLSAVLDTKTTFPGHLKLYQ